MIDINELRRKLRSDDLIDHVDIHANVKSILTELLDRLEAVENDSARHKALAESALRVAKGWEDKCDELRAKITEMERQEPVASVWRCDNGHIHGSCEKTLPMGAKLYALPGAKGE